MKPASELPFQAYNTCDGRTLPRWRIGNGGGTDIAIMASIDEHQAADAAYIVHAANLYPELAEALRACFRAMSAHGLCGNKDCVDCRKMQNTVYALLAKCKGGK